jgi:hypothetical protein
MQKIIHLSLSLRLLLIVGHLLSPLDRVRSDVSLPLDHSALAATYNI